MTDEETIQKLLDLKLATMAQAFRDLLAQAPGSQLSFSEQVAIMVTLAPLTFAVFDTLSVAGLWVNLLAIPFVSFVLDCFCLTARGHRATIVVEIPPRGRNSPRTSAHTGFAHFTTSSSTWLTTFS